MASSESLGAPAQSLRADPPTALLTRLAAGQLASDVPPLADLQALFEELNGAKVRVEERRASAATAKAKALGEGTYETRGTSEVSGASAIVSGLAERLGDLRSDTPASSGNALAKGKGSVASLDEDIKPDLVGPLAEIKGVPAPLDRVLREASVATASGSRHSSPDVAAQVGAAGPQSPRSSRLGEGKNKRKRESGVGTPTSSELDAGHATEPDSPDVPLHQNRIRQLDSITSVASPAPSRIDSPAVATPVAPPTGPSSQLLAPPQSSQLTRTSSAMSVASGAPSGSVPPLGIPPKNRKGATPASRMSSIASFGGSGIRASSVERLPASSLPRGVEVKESEGDEAAPPVKPKLRFGLPKAEVQELALPPALLTGSTPAPVSAIPKSGRSALGPGYTDDFSFPARSLVPPAPISRPPPPHPKVQSEVTGDFSKAKPPGSQVSIHQFQSWVNEHYLRSYGEDDLAFLAPQREETAMLQVPPLGKHYSEVWREEDTGEFMTPVPTEGGEASSSGAGGSNSNVLDYPAMKRVRRDEVTDASVHGEKIEVGPVTERLIASLRSIDPVEAVESMTDEEKAKRRELKRENKTKMAKGKAKAVEDGGPDVDEPGWVEGGAGQAPMQLDSVELESRIKRELKYLGILTDDEIDWSQRVDDPISSALRATQRAYRAQHAVNEARRARLAELVRDRMAWQEYESLKDGLDRAVEQGWIKRQRQEVRKKAASRKKAAIDHEGKDKDDGKDKDRIPLPEGLVAALDKRQRFIETVGSIFEGPDRGRGYYRRIPETSIYADIVDLAGEKPREAPDGTVTGPYALPNTRLVP